MHWCFVISFLPVVLLLIGSSVSSLEESAVICRERQRLLGTDYQDRYELTVATPGSSHQLACHYCHEEDDHAPKLWYYEKRLDFDDEPQEVKLGMSQNPSENHFQLGMSHGLIIQNVTPDDSGIYLCHGLYSDNYHKYSYLVDVVLKPKETYIANSQSELPDNSSLLSSSTLPEPTRLRSHFGIQLQVSLVWTQPRPCDPCTLSRKTYSICTLKPEVYNETVLHGLGILDDSTRAIYLASFELSCYSIEIRTYFPQIFEMLQKIPQYVLVDSCVPPYGEVCNPDVDQSERREPYYRNHYLLPEGSDLFLTCPETSIESHIVWRKDGSVINPEKQKSPHIVLNSFNTLYLLDGTGFETSGNYTCFVNGVRMQETIVRFVSGGAVKQAMYHRHMFYLMYIFLLSFILYMGGVVSASMRRDGFKKISWDNNEEDLKTLEVIVKQE